MLGSVPDGPDLRETITTLVSRADREDRLRKMRQHLPQRLTAAVAWLFHLVEHSYLLEFLMFDHLSIRMVKRDFFLPGTPHFSLGALIIVIGSEQITLDPAGFDACHARVRMSNARHDLVHDFYCDLSAEQPGWTAAAEESGLRRLIRTILPEHQVDLDEARFRTMLNQVLLGPQPLFSIGPAAVKHNLSHLLDKITSDLVRQKLAIGVRSSASHLGQQLQLAAPVAREAVMKALPGRRLPAGLTDDTAQAEVGYRGPRDPDAGAAPLETSG